MSEVDDKLQKVIRDSVEAGDLPGVTHIKAVGLLDLEFDRYMRSEFARIFSQPVEDSNA